MVDDGSTDATAAVGREAAGPRSPTTGSSACRPTRARGPPSGPGWPRPGRPYIAYMDADMAIDPLAVPLLLDGLSTTTSPSAPGPCVDSMVETTYVVRSLMGRLFNGS